jgi:Leucine rich repeat
MEQEIDLPPISVLPQDLPLALSDSHWRRKRPRFEHDPKTSSDPALFSSDEQAPTAENYFSKRRKENWSGTWWGEKFNGNASNASNGAKRKFTRNVDSGVWMGSEGTDTSLDDDLLEEFRSASNPAADEAGMRASGLEDAEEDKASKPQPLPQPKHVTAEAARKASLHAAFEDVIDRCLEKGDENVDLSSMSLESVPNESLRRLKALTKHAMILNIAPPTQIGYSPIEAALRLYLSNNNIADFPSEILNLTNLRALSLRHNRLTEIPAALAQLPHLELLNISGNQLQHLPYEMLRLFDNEDFALIATPNPFLELQSPIPPHLDLRGSRSWRAPTLVVQSTPTFFYADASTIKTDVNLVVANSGRVPSLLELALRKCKNPQELADMDTWCSTGGGPSSLKLPLALAQQATAYGDFECTICSRCFVVPRVQWLEWWDVLNYPMSPLRFPRGLPPAIIPFLRRGCSWTCINELGHTV